MLKEEFYGKARRDLLGPLEGLRVLEAATTWAGPLCASLLGDFGADVIKVEPPDGEVARKLPPFLPGHERPLSFMHTTVNRNKRSLTLDLHQEAGQDVFRRLAVGCDFVVENFRPGTMAEWGLGYANLSELKPDLIYVSISGYGQFGPDSDQVSYDPMAQAAGGFMALNGDPQGDPVKAATWLADDLSGMHGAIAALAALRHRDQTGEGQHIDVALLDSMLAGSNGNLTLGALSVPLPRMGSEFVFCSPGNVFACQDGHVFAGALLDRQWKGMAVAIGRPDLAEHEDFATTPKRIQQRNVTNQLMRDWCRERTVQEVVDRLTEQDCPAAPVRSCEQAAQDPHVLERDMLQSVAQEDGRHAPITGPPAKLSRTPVQVRSGAAALGAHTDEILAEIGLNEEAIANLRRSKAV